MAKANPRRTNGSARRKLAGWLRAQGRPCWICQAFGLDGTIDYSLPARHPWSFEVDELHPVSRWREFGYSSPEACALDRANVAAAHRRCNQWKSNKSVEEVLAVAKGGGLGPRSRPGVSGETSRDW